LPLQEPEQLASDRALEAAADLALALALGGASRHIPAGWLVAALAASQLRSGQGKNQQSISDRET
jgi:hypothetical protein